MLGVAHNHNILKSNGHCGVAAAAVQVRIWTADWRFVGDLSHGSWDLAATAAAASRGNSQIGRRGLSRAGSRPGTGPLPAGAARGFEGEGDEGDGGATAERLWALLQSGGGNGSESDGEDLHLKDRRRPAAGDWVEGKGPAEDSGGCNGRDAPIPPEMALAAFLARSAELFPPPLTAAAAAASAAGLMPTRSAAMRAALPAGWMRASSRRDVTDCFRRIPLAELADTRRPPAGLIAGETPDRSAGRGGLHNRGRQRPPGVGVAAIAPVAMAQRSTPGPGISGSGGLESRIAALWSFAPAAATLPPVSRQARSISSMN